MASTRQLSVLLLTLLALLAITVVQGQLDPVTCSARDGTCIRIGIFRCTNLATCTLPAYQKLIDWYVGHVQNTLGGVIIGLPVFFIPIDLTTLGTSAASLASSVNSKFIGTTPGRTLADFVILPPGSAWGDAMVKLEAAKIPAIAGNSPLSTLYQCGSTAAAFASQPGCTAVNSRRFQYAHGVANAGEQFFQPWVGLMKLKKAQSIAVVQTTVSLYQSIQSGVASAAADYNIPVTYVKTAPLVNGTLVDPDLLDSIIDDLFENQPDGLVLATQNCVPWITRFSERDYAPKSLATVLCTDSAAANTALGLKQSFVVGSAQWSPDMNGNDYIENGDTAPWSLFPHVKNAQLIGDSSPKQFQTLFQTLQNTTAVPGYDSAGVLAPFTMLEGAINLAGVSNPDLVNDQLKLYYQSSYFGLLSTNRYGANQQKQLVINQRDADGKLGIISPPSAATLDFIYPMPPFSERTYTQVMLGTEIEYIVIALICVCFLFTFGLCAYLFANRGHQVFQAAGLPFYLMMGLGCMMAYGSVLAWGVENNAQSCHARIWLWTICFHMFVDPLLASSWRISRIFSQKLQTVKLTNKMVGGVCVLLFTPQLIINIIWTIVAPLEPRVVTSDILQPAHTSYTTCSAGDEGVIFAGVTLGYSALLLVSACYLAYKVRKAYRMFNDAKPIAMSMYIFTITAAIILVIQIALNTQEVKAQKVLFGLRSIGILISYQSSLALLYFRRILGQTEISKYKQGNRTHIESSEDATTSGGGGAVKGGKVEGSNGKMVFQKGSVDHSHASRGDSHGMVRNVHVHIQPPASAGVPSSPGYGPSNELQVNNGTSSPTIPRPSQRNPTSTPSKSAHTGSTIAMSSLALENLSATPKLSGFNSKPRPAQLGIPAIVQLPAAIPLPSHSELLAMDNAQLISLVQQFHAQNQVLRSQIRTQNIAAGAASRGEFSPGAPSRQTSLPGTPDRSPRFHTATPAEGVSRRPSFVHLAGTMASSIHSPSTHLEGSPHMSESVALRQFGQPESDALAAFTRQNSQAEASEGVTASSLTNSSGSGDSNASVGSPNHAHHATVTAAGVEISPVSEIGPGSLSGVSENKAQEE